MRPYRKHSVKKWGWTSLLINEKPLFLPISFKKVPVKSFNTDAEKGIPHRKTRFPRKRNKRGCNVCWFKMEAIIHRNFGLEKSLEKVEKSSFIQKKGIPFHHVQLYLWKLSFFDSYFHFLSSLANVFRFLNVLSFFYICRFWMWLFIFAIDVFFMISWLSLSVFGVPWKPLSRRGSCQLY